VEVIMFRATGTGRCEVDADFSGVGVLRALLYNFDFDDFADLKYRPLKPEHANFLADKVVPLLKDDAGNIWMTGSASRIGNKAWNMELSQTRVGRVVDFLQTKGIKPEQIQEDAVGEEWADAAGHVDDDPRDRSVVITVLPKIQFGPIIPPPRKVPPKPPVTRHFKIAIVYSLAVNETLLLRRLLKLKTLGVGPALERSVFTIWDTRNKLACSYVYLGVGVGAGVSFTSDASITSYGPWTEFTTEKPISCWQFGRYASLRGAGAATQSINWITIETPRGVNDIHSLRISTGTSVGAGASATWGDLFLLDKPRHFEGDRPQGVI
jgi:OmpA family